MYSKQRSERIPFVCTPVHTGMQQYRTYVADGVLYPIHLVYLHVTPYDLQAEPCWSFSFSPPLSPHTWDVPRLTTYCTKYMYIRYIQLPTYTSGTLKMRSPKPHSCTTTPCWEGLPPEMNMSGYYMYIQYCTCTIPTDTTVHYHLIPGNPH
jgi:hypothetical protein